MSKCFHFHAFFGKNWQIKRLAPPPFGSCPPPRNPGSATIVNIFFQKAINIMNFNHFFFSLRNKGIDAVADAGFSRGGYPNSQKCYYFSNFFAENCMKMKRTWTPGGSPLGSANEIYILYSGGSTFFHSGKRMAGRVEEVQGESG